MYRVDLYRRVEAAAEERHDKAIPHRDSSPVLSKRELDMADMTSDL